MCSKAMCQTTGMHACRLSCISRIHMHIENSRSNLGTYRRAQTGCDSEKQAEREVPEVLLRITDTSTERLRVGLAARHERQELSCAMPESRGHAGESRGEASGVRTAAGEHIVCSRRASKARLPGSLLRSVGLVLGMLLSSLPGSKLLAQPARTPGRSVATSRDWSPDADSHAARRYTVLSSVFFQAFFEPNRSSRGECLRFPSIPEFNSYFSG